MSAGADSPAGAFVPVNVEMDATAPVLRGNFSSEKGDTMKIVNLTPHVLNMIDTVIDGVDVGNVPTSGTVARVEETHTIVAPGLATITRGPIVGLPDPEPGVWFAVARPVAYQAADQQPWRTDLLVVDKMVRDEAGNVIGARGFATVI